MVETQKSEPVVFKGKYYYGTGRRKNAVARVRVYSEKGPKSVVVNGKSYSDYFPALDLRRIAEDCFRVGGIKEDIAVSAVITGGGKKGQVEALRHGIARAFVAMDDKYRALFREAGFLTRDPRVKERKKPGLKKARRAPQWQKR